MLITDTRRKYHSEMFSTWITISLPTPHSKQLTIQSSLPRFSPPQMFGWGSVDLSYLLKLWAHWDGAQSIQTFNPTLQTPAEFSFLGISGVFAKVSITSLGLTIRQQLVIGGHVSLQLVSRLSSEIKIMTRTDSRHINILASTDPLRIQDGWCS